MPAKAGTSRKEDKGTLLNCRRHNLALVSGRIRDFAQGSNSLGPLHSRLALLEFPAADPAGESFMPMQVCMGAMMMCTMGMAPSSLVVLPVNRVMTDEVPDANIMDHIPLINIMPFGMCISPANPMVAAATAAALGVLTPMPCIPATVAPWVPGAPTVLLAEMPTLDNTSMLMCMWAGVITFVTPGEFTVMVP
jgi:hypothetical protein